MKKEISLFWFRRDLRLNDNAALYHALKSKYPVVPIFIFDRNILDQLEEKADRRISFIYTALQDIQQQLVQIKSSLEVYYGYPVHIFQQLLKKYNIQAVYTNHDYEPYAIERDNHIKQLLLQHSISLYTYKDQVIFEKNEIIKNNGKPYTVFTPYSKCWKAALTKSYIKPYNTKKYYTNFYKQPLFNIPTIKKIGFIPTQNTFPSEKYKKEVIITYSHQRDFPAIYGTSRLGVHLRFGTISIRKLIQKALQFNTIFLNELIWREFYQMILYHFPQVGKSKAFKPAYENIKWINNEIHFKKWCNGQTGYPIVDAGMRELNETGFMHNRVRMVTASFLCKHLLIDWRWGEAYFAQKLLDFDLAANNGNWQWAAGCGCDAAPYFRIFNPAIQTKKFDNKLKYIQKWIPELDKLTYPKPIIDHEMARKRALEVYHKALQ